MKDLTVDEVVDYIPSLTPEGKWTMSSMDKMFRFILTGGEPFFRMAKSPCRFI